jgi:hypothetical protein
MVNDNRAVTIEKDTGPQRRVPHTMATIGHATITESPRTADCLIPFRKPAIEEQRTACGDTTRPFLTAVTPDRSGNRRASPAVTACITAMQSPARRRLGKQPGH